MHYIAWHFRQYLYIFIKSDRCTSQGPFPQKIN